jgi:hypothetical protein
MYKNTSLRKKSNSFLDKFIKLKNKSKSKSKSKNKSKLNQVK